MEKDFETIHRNCDSYIESFIKLPNSILEELEKPEADMTRRNPHVGRQVGAFIQWLVTLLDVKRALEFGTCAGFSSVYLGEALRKTGGSLVSVELDETRANTTEANLHKAGLSDVVQLIRGDASQVVRELEGPFDLILQDSAKPLYPVMLDRCVELLRLGGVLVADDALFPPFEVEIENRLPIDEYNKKCFAHPALSTCMVPVGDGLTLSVKLQ